jgi:hypothetical protein
VSSQGASDISGTLSKLHRRIEKSFFYYLFRAQLSQLFVEAETKINRNFPPKMNEQEATKAMIVSSARIYRPSFRENKPKTLFYS